MTLLHHIPNFDCRYLDDIHRLLYDIFHITCHINPKCLSALGLIWVEGWYGMSYEKCHIIIYLSYTWFSKDLSSKEASDYSHLHMHTHTHVCKQVRTHLSNYKTPYDETPNIYFHCNIFLLILHKAWNTKYVRTLIVWSFLTW
jgi:hypothetical protein